MVFDLSGKIALVTGGGSGIGLKYAKELLRNGVKGVTLADLNADLAKTALAEITEEFGPNRAQFVTTDVTDYKQFESAFKKTIETYNHVDILINNAGIMNDKIWEKEIALNLNGVVNGMLLGLEHYLQKHKQGPEAVILNISSVAGVDPLPFIPIYCATKFAIVGLTKTWGHSYHYERTGVRVFAICPGATDTPLIGDLNGRNLGPPYEAWLKSSVVVNQAPQHVAREAVKLIKSSSSGTIWVIEGGEPAYQYIVPERGSMAK